jgi:Ca2+-binding EF-hand superfamily protein
MAQTPARSAAALDSGALIAAADADGDGAVTRAEFIAERARAFALIDRDGDRYLARDELLAVAPPNVPRSLVPALISRIDGDGDGRLSSHEFNAAPTPVFDRLDGDGDGVLDSSEIAAAQTVR